MTQQIIDIGENANDGTGDPLRQAFQSVNDNFANVWNAGPVGTQVVISTNLVTTNVTNLGLHLAGNGVGNITVQSNIVPSIDAVYDLGGTNKRFADIYGQYFYGNGRFLTGIASSKSVETVQLRRNTAAGWTAANIILAAGEPGLETDTRLTKYGDGTTRWNDLAYSTVATSAAAAPASETAPDPAVPGMLWFDSADSEKQLKVYVDSSQDWKPIAPKRIRYPFGESTNWLVQHNRNTTAYTVNLTDSDGDLFYAKVSTIDSNSFSIKLTESTSGIVDVAFL